MTSHLLNVSNLKVLVNFDDLKTRKKTKNKRKQIVNKLEYENVLLKRK